MTAIVHGSCWQPEDKCSSITSIFQDEFEQPSRTALTSVIVHCVDESQGHTLGQQLLGLLKTGDVPTHNEAWPSPAQSKTKLQSGASLFIPKAAQSHNPPGVGAQQQGDLYNLGNQDPTLAFDKEMLCWEYMHRGHCPRQSTCRWIHPRTDISSDWDYAVASVGGFVPQSTRPQGVSDTLVSQVAQITDRQNEAQPPGVEPSLSLPLGDLKSQPFRIAEPSGFQNFDIDAPWPGLTDVQDLDDNTPWPDFINSSRLESLMPQLVWETSVAVGKAARQISWADLQDSDTD